MKSKNHELMDFTIDDLGIQEIDVYDIEVEDHHNFFANDILVHNSAYITVDDLVKKYCPDKSPADIVNYVEKFVFDIIQPKLNAHLLEYAKSMGIDDCKISFKLECIGPSLIMVAKKRYSFDIYYSEGVRYKEPKTKVMGIEIVRSSTPSVVKGYLKKALDVCMKGTEAELQKTVGSIRRDFMQRPYVDISFPRGVNGMDIYSNSSSIYNKGCPVHVRGALLYNNQLSKLGLDVKYEKIANGEKVKFVYLKMPNKIHENVISYKNSIPHEFMLDKHINYEMQFEKSFLAPLNNILEAIGWTAEEVNTLDC